MLQAKINRSPIEEASALGAVLMSGFALGTWNDWNELNTLRKSGFIFEPEMNFEATEKLYAGWKIAVRQSRIKD